MMLRNFVGIALFAMPIRLVGCYSTRAQVRHAAPVVFSLDFDGGEHVYRVHPIHVQLLTDPVIMLAKKEHGCASGSESRTTSHKPLSND
jgi:hypothetical protein